MDSKRFSEILERLGAYVSPDDPEDQLEQAVLILERMADEKEFLFISWYGRQSLP